MLARLLIRWASNVVALYVAAAVLDGLTYGDRWTTLVGAAAVFTLVNAWVKPVVTVLSIPFIVLTLGLFLLVVNILMLYLTDWVVADFDVRGFGSTALAAIIVSLVNALLQRLLPKR